MALRPDTKIRREEIYRDAVAVIAREYPTELQIEDVAHSIGTSRRQLQRVLDEVGGISFRSLLTKVRMHNACKLLVATDEPVNLVARRVGYSQPAQFAKTFRNHYGAVPSVYRTSPRPTAVAPAANGATAWLRTARTGDAIAVPAAPSR